MNFEAFAQVDLKKPHTHLETRWSYVIGCYMLGLLIVCFDTSTVYFRSVLYSQLQIPLNLI